MIKTKKSIWDAMQTCYSCSATDWLSYSAIYWSFRIILFVAGLGILSYITYSFREPLAIITIIRVIIAAGALVITASIYRNFLVSHLTLQDKYPSGLFFLLNIPLINIFAWAYSLFIFPERKSINSSQAQERFNELQTRFLKENMNEGWRVTLIIFSVLSLLNQFIRNGLGGDGVNMHLISTVVPFCFLLWFFYTKNSYSYKALLIILCTNIILATILREESTIQPVMAAQIINLVMFYAMFYFDKFKYEEDSALRKK